MDTVGYIAQSLRQVRTRLLASCEGLTQEQVLWRPLPHANSIGFILWHMTRAEDDRAASLMGSSPLWESQGWYERFGRSDDASDRGRGHTSDEVREFRPPGVDVLPGYYKAVRGRTDAFLGAVSAEDLDKPVQNLAGDGTVPMRVRLEMTVVDNIQHSGQIAYLRGLLKGKGWFAS